MQEEEYRHRAVVVSRCAHEILAFGVLPGEVLDLGGKVAKQDNCQQEADKHGLFHKYEILFINI